MFVKEATASGLNDAVRSGLDKRLLNVLACSVTSPCISPTSSWIATRDAAKVSVAVVVDASKVGFVGVDFSEAAPASAVVVAEAVKTLYTCNRLFIHVILQ